MRPADQVLDRRHRVLIGNLFQRYAALLGEQRRRHARGSVAVAREDGLLACLGPDDKVLHRFVRCVFRHEHEARDRAVDRDGGEIVGVVAHLLVEAGIGGEARGRAVQQGVPIGRRLPDDRGADHRCGARFVVDDERLARELLELVPDDTRDDVPRAARPERHDDPDDGLGGPSVLGAGGEGQGAQQGEGVSPVHAASGNRWRRPVNASDKAPRRNRIPPA